MNQPIYNFIRKFILVFQILLGVLFTTNLLGQFQQEVIKTLAKQGMYEEAESFILKQKESIAKSDTSNYIAANKCHAWLYYQKGEYEKSVQFYDSLLSFMPPSHPETGNILANLGRAYLNLENFGEFAKQTEFALAFYGNSVGRNSREYINTLNTLGFAYQLNGEYKESEKVLSEAKAILEKKQEYDLLYARILNQLGKTTTELNRFQQAEELLVASMQVKEKVKGKQSTDYALSQYHYAVLLQVIGRHEEALEQMEEAIEKVENEKENSIGFQQFKASILNSMGKQEEAAALYESLKPKYLELKKEKSSDCGKLNFDLADIYLDLKKYDLSLDHIEEALTLFRKFHGEKHPYYAKALRLKGKILLEIGQYDGIESLFQESSRIIRQKYTRNHIEFFKSEYAYFLFLKKTRDYSRAIQKLERIDGIITEHIVEASRYLSIQEIIEVTDLYHEYFQEVLSLTSLNPDNEVLTALAFDCSLFYKGYILETLLSIKKAIRRSNEITQLSERLTELKLQQQSAYDKEEIDHNKIANIQEMIDQVNIEISRNLGKIRMEDEKASWDLIQYELSEDEAVVDFVRFKDENDQDDLYGAMILRPEDEAPQFVTLFIESDITRYFKEKITTSDQFINRLYQSSDRGLKPIEQMEKISLYDLIWKPLAPKLDGVERVYYVCDGILHNIALHAIPTGLESVVSDEFNLMQMTSFKNLFRRAYTPYEEGVNKALLIGGVKYGQAENSKVENRNKRKLWNNLPFSELEIQAINDIVEHSSYDTETLMGDAPEKSRVKQLLSDNKNIRLIHFATHGYFETEDLLEVKSKVELTRANMELTHSGLVLARANELDPGEAVLSAFEISELNLEKTDLVVLSACETGLGKVYENEGVYGMQRAFKIAGAECIIMSLWQVPDRESKVFMTEFYQNYLEKGMSIPDAFYQTQRTMKSNLLDPVKWAGFVLLK